MTLQRFLESPRIPAEHKLGMLTRALGDRVPRVFLRFLQALVHNRRQTLIPAISENYDTLLDASNGIVHARVTVGRETSDEERTLIAARLSKAVGRTVVPHLAVDPDILGGVVVRGLPQLVGVDEPLRHHRPDECGGGQHQDDDADDHDRDAEQFGDLTADQRAQQRGHDGVIAHVAPAEVEQQTQLVGVEQQ